ncbi:MAG: rhodanese family protein [Pseudolabrys sp.]
MSELKSISPARAAELIRDGAVLVDIRELDEHARERIPGARHHALSRLGDGTVAREGDDILVFHCRSGARTLGNAARLAAISGDCDAYVLEGGIDAWRKAGLPVTLDRGQPIDIMRQMQITAGTIALAGVLLGVFVSPNFYALPAFIGGGLMFAGITGYCPMVRLLTRMPWNRRAYAAAK